jgi:hypothetical protein
MLQKVCDTFHAPFFPGPRTRSPPMKTANVRRAMTRSGPYPWSRLVNRQEPQLIPTDAPKSVPDSTYAKSMTGIMVSFLFGFFTLWLSLTKKRWRRGIHRDRVVTPRARAAIERGLTRQVDSSINGAFKYSQMSFQSAFAKPIRGARFLLQDLKGFVRAPARWPDEARNALPPSLQDPHSLQQ